jgi:glycosyltransferase involved in cell wall biosynthesis
MGMLRGIYRKAWSKNQTLFHEMAKVVEYLQHAGIKTMLLKGASLSLLYYKNNGARPMADIDLLVPYKQVSEKIFDAVYDARINPFKRHNLANRIQSLALITARAPYLHDESYTRSIKNILPQAHWFNDPLETDYRWMSFSDINTALNQCRVGLCLSAEEGAMLASMQYLLAGLPIVSTQSRGGRDEFFAPDYVQIVGDNAEDVAAGVSKMRECSVPPDEIRRLTLEKIEQHKLRLFDLLDAICSAEGLHVDLRQRWDSWNVRLFANVTPDVIRKHIEDAAISSTYSPT